MISNQILDDIIAEQGPWVPMTSPPVPNTVLDSSSPSSFPSAPAAFNKATRSALRAALSSIFAARAGPDAVSAIGKDRIAKTPQRN